MIGGVTRHMLPQLPGVPHLHVNRPLRAEITLISATFFGWKAPPSSDFPQNGLFDILLPNSNNVNCSTAVLCFVTLFV